MMQVQDVTLIAQDRYALAGQLYVSVQPSKAAIVFAGATGVPQYFYHRFAEYAQQQGYDVLLFDYRGIGKSKQGSLKGFEMSFLDWGRLDLAAAVDYMAQRNVPLFVVGHSYGGHALGLLPNHHLIKAAYFFGTGAGWHGYMPKKESLKVRLMWNTVFPAMVLAAGYLPWSKLDLGEDLPLNVYQQWRKWCKNPHYFFDDPEYADMLKKRFAFVKMPIYFGNALDDDWALAASRDAFVQYYRNAQVMYVDLNPKDYGLNQIGHMGYFRANATAIWSEIFSRFNAFL